MVTEINGRNYYDVRLMFKKQGDGSKVVRITVRESKKGKPLREEEFPFTDDINDNDHNYWTLHQGQQVSVYHRIEKHVYLSAKQRRTIPTNLGQKLEALVQRTLKPQN